MHTRLDLGNSGKWVFGDMGVYLALNGSAETLEFLSKCILLAKVVLLSMMHLD